MVTMITTCKAHRDHLGPPEPTARSQAGRWGAATVARPANICTVASAGTASSADATCPATIAASASLGAADFRATSFTASFFIATILTATASFFGASLFAASIAASAAILAVFSFPETL